MAKIGLNVHHNIHLTREQRYALHEGEDVETVGVSISVWRYEGHTSEPAREVFCKYHLRNTGEEIPVKVTENGFLITLPNKEPENGKGVRASSMNLLDVRDGGSESLVYREHNRLKFEHKILNVIHFVTFGTVDNLKKSLLTSNP